MLKRYIVKGHSMEPAFKENDRLLLNSFLFHVKEGDVIVFSDGKRDYLKRVSKVTGSTLTVAGDNGGHGTVWTISQEQVKGKFLMKY